MNRYVLIIVLIGTLCLNEIQTYPAGTWREVVRHRRSELTNEEEDNFVIPKNTQFGKSENVTSSPSTTETTTTTISTSTFSPNTLDDPNFIPGQFLDTDGNVKIAPPPPVKNRLELIILQFGNRSQEIWLIAGLVLATVVSMILNSLFFSLAFAKIFHLYNETKFKNESLPGSIDAKKVVAKKLLEVYDNQPASFKNVELNLEGKPDLKVKKSQKKTKKKPLPITRAKKTQRMKKKKKN